MPAPASTARTNSDTSWFTGSPAAPTTCATPPCHFGWNSGGDPAQIAARAGHSVAVLLSVYGHCIHGRDDLSRSTSSSSTPQGVVRARPYESQRLHPTARLHGSQRLHRPSEATQAVRLPASARDRKWVRGGPRDRLGRASLCFPCPDRCRFLRAAGRVRGARSARAAAPQAPLTRPAGSGSLPAGGNGSEPEVGRFLAGVGLSLETGVALIDGRDGDGEEAARLT